MSCAATLATQMSYAATLATEMSHAATLRRQPATHTEMCEGRATRPAPRLPLGSTSRGRSG